MRDALGCGYPHRSHKHILSNEDWYPTVDGKVRVNLSQLDATTWRVSMWGGDDLGMELDTDNENHARFVFDRIVDLTTRAELEALGLR